MSKKTLHGPTEQRKPREQSTPKQHAPNRAQKLFWPQRPKDLAKDECLTFGWARATEGSAFTLEQPKASRQISQNSYWLIAGRKLMK